MGDRMYINRALSLAATLYQCPRSNNFLISDISPPSSTSYTNHRTKTDIALHILLTGPPGSLPTACVSPTSFALPIQRAGVFPASCPNPLFLFPKSVYSEFCSFCFSWEEEDGKKGTYKIRRHRYGPTGDGL